MQVYMKIFTLLLSFNIALCEIRYCNDGLGVCTPFHKCSNLTIFEDGSDHINVRFNIELETDACHYLEMCCDPEDVIAPSEDRKAVDLNGDVDVDITRTNGDDSKSGKIEVFGLNSVNEEDPDKCNINTHECIPFFLCLEDHTTDGSNILASRFGGEKCETSSQVCCAHNKNVQKVEPKTCGLSNPEGIGFTVTNGVDEAQFAEFPWMAAISEVQLTGEKHYLCGGSLIDPHVILTAAHCVNTKDASTLIVTLGEWDTQSTSEPMPHSDHEVVQIIVHSGFGTVNLFNDIALLVLSNPVKRTAHINTVCLPPQNSKLQGNCIASGWGSDKFGRPDLYRVNLKKLELPVVPLKPCQDNLRTTQLGPRFRIHNSFMCAGGEHNIDTCTGDGGSPLVCPIPGHENVFFQAGIVSWGIECGKENIPGVYANVAKFRTWIDDQMSDLGYGTSSYTFEST